MPKENRFAGLGEAMQSESSDDDPEQGDESEQQDEAGQGAEETEDESTPADAVSTPDEGTTPRAGTAGTETADEEADSEDRQTESGDESDEDIAESEHAEPEATPEAEVEANETGDGESEAKAEERGPAFEFEATTAKSIYVREETLERLDDAEFEVESLLRREHDIRDLTGREFHDALIHVAAAYVDEIADVVVETREE